MKSLSDPRHQKRRKLVQELFAHEFNNSSQPPSDEAKAIIDYAQIADPKIHEAAPMWPLERLNKVDLAILHLALYELHQGETPQKVVIDEAVELAKEFGSENSSSFVNGVLGTILKST